MQLSPWGTPAESDFNVPSVGNVLHSRYMYEQARRQRLALQDAGTDYSRQSSTHASLLGIPYEQ